jgi:hypothetical protein
MGMLKNRPKGYFNPAVMINSVFFRSSYEGFTEQELDARQAGQDTGQAKFRFNR